MSRNANPYDLDDDRGVRLVNDLAGRLAHSARSQRYTQYRRTMRPQPSERILDVGCGNSWSLAALDPDALVTGVDLVERDGFERPNQQFVKADACDLPFADDSFDLAYSNSLIEHIPVELRSLFADEVRRVGRRYWIQTPNYWFPLEPHALLPGIQFLPASARRRAWALSPRRIEFEDSLELLSRRALIGLFPDALILRERIGPLTKSLIAIGPRADFTPLAAV